MIFDGRNGYVSGNLNQSNGLVLAMIKGPVKNKNWNITTVNPTYNIIMSTGAVGTVKLQGTNDIAFRGVGPEMDFLPTDGASWSDLQGATSTTATGSITVSYEFLRIIIATAGAGYVLEAWVRWT